MTATSSPSCVTAWCTWARDAAAIAFLLKDEKKASIGAPNSASSVWRTTCVADAGVTRAAPTRWARLSGRAHLERQRGSAVLQGPEGVGELGGQHVVGGREVLPGLDVHAAQGPGGAAGVRE